MNKLLPLSIQTYNYLTALDRRAWTNAEWTGPRYGVVTSNMSESLNNQIMKFRYMETLGAIKGMGLIIMEQHAERREREWTGEISKRISKIIQDNVVKGRKMTVRRSSTEEGIVINTIGEEKRVNIRRGECTCGKYQDDEYPCIHGCALIMVIRGNISEYVSDVYKKPTYNRTYKGEVRGVINEELSADGITKGPVKIVKRGKPKRRRIEIVGEIMR